RDGRGLPAERGQGPRRPAREAAPLRQAGGPAAPEDGSYERAGRERRGGAGAGPGGQGGHSWAALGRSADAQPIWVPTNTAGDFSSPVNYSTRRRFALEHTARFAVRSTGCGNGTGEEFAFLG